MISGVKNENRTRDPDHAFKGCLLILQSRSCTVSEISRDIGRKSPIVTYPTSIWRPH